MKRSPEIYTPSQPDANDQDLWQSFRNEQNSSPSPLKQRHQSIGHASLKTTFSDLDETTSSSLKEAFLAEPFDSEEAFPAQLPETKAHAQAIEDQFEAIYQSNHHYYDHRRNLESARNLLENSEFTTEAITATFGPSLILELEQTGQLPENVHLIKSADQPVDTPADSFNISVFINDLANLPPENCLEWQRDCKNDLIRHLDRFTDPELGINLNALVKNSSDSGIASHLLDIANYVPDFDIKSYLDNLAMRDPITFMENTDSFLNLDYHYSVRTLADSLQADIAQYLKHAPTQEYKEMYSDEYIDYLVSLREGSSDQDIAYLDQIINDIKSMSKDPTTVYHPNIALNPIPNSVITSFIQKAKQYRKNMVEPHQELSVIDHKLKFARPNSDLSSLTMQQLQLLIEIQELASTTLASFTPEELSYFRRLYISRANSYDGTEDMGSLFTVDNPNYELTCLHTADTDFESSDEFYDYVNRQYEDRVLNEWGELLATYPGIFNQVDDLEVCTLVSDALKDFPVERLNEVDELKRHQYYHEADQKLVQIISDFLHLPETPKIVYESESDLYAGSYNPSPNSVTLVRDREGDETFEWQDIVNTIAHELWHAHQYDEISRDTERGRLYDINFDYYFDLGYSSAEFSTYNAQLVEVEARAFGEAFEKLYHERDPSSQTRITVYPAEAFNQAFYS